MNFRQLRPIRCDDGVGSNSGYRLYTDGSDLDMEQICFSGIEGAQTWSQEIFWVRVLL